MDKFFFSRPVLQVAPDLLGCYLVRKIGKKIYRERIIEVEAYDGENDLACHGCKGKTKRTEPMFGEAGRFYIYFIYGMYNMLNIVTGDEGYPAAILIRGTEYLKGPGRLTKALSIDKNLNGAKAEVKSGLWFELGESDSPKKIKRTPRIGVAYAGPIWSKKKYRFVLIKN